MKHDFVVYFTRTVRPKTVTNLENKQKVTQVLTQSMRKSTMNLAVEQEI